MKVATYDRQAFITTYSGRVIDPFNPDPEQISLEDIFQSLSLQTRFCGHTSEFLSIAQHSVMVSDMCETEMGKNGGCFMTRAKLTYQMFLVR